jgi:hypothetical protein
MYKIGDRVVSGDQIPGEIEAIYPNLEEALKVFLPGWSVESYCWGKSFTDDQINGPWALVGNNVAGVITITPMSLIQDISIVKDPSAKINLLDLSSGEKETDLPLYAPDRN